MRKQILFLAALLTATVCNLNATTVTNVKYIDATGVEQTCAEATVVESASSQVSWSAGWYVVTGADVKITGATCSNAVHLILADGAKLTTTGGMGVAGVEVYDENSFAIYGQTNQTGTLIATGGDYQPGIGSNMGGSNITINGGIITATGGSNSAGIGGGDRGSASNITINGGTVTANAYKPENGSGNSAGIGGGNQGSASNITINGGTVTANGNQSFGAGIGGGQNGSASNISINGGTVKVINSRVAIGSGMGGSDASNVKIKKNLTIIDTDRHGLIADDREDDADISSSFTTSINNVEIYALETVEFSETETTQAQLEKYLHKYVNAKIMRTFYKDGGNNTICLPFFVNDMSKSPLAGYSKLQSFQSATIVNPGQPDETLELTMTDETSITHGMPYIITWGSGANLVNPTFEKVYISTTEVIPSSKVNNVTFVGTLVPKAVDADDKGILFVGTGAELKWPNVTGNINSFRAYFELDLSASSPLRQGMKAMLAGEKTTPTGNANVNANANSMQKLIEAGKVVIISNSVRYNLQGQIIK